MRALLPEHPGARFALVVVAILVAMTVLASIIDALAPSPSGPGSSSFSTSPDGLAAWAELLEKEGRDVRALRKDPTADNLPAGGTVVIVDADRVSRGEARALRDFARDGGRVVAGGLATDRWARVIVGDDDLEWGPGGSDRVRPFVPVPETRGIQELRTKRNGVWSDPAGTLPVIGSRTEGALVVTRRVGDGRVVLLADVSPLHNELLDEADNARFALEVAGDRDDPVTFVEGVHGYGEQTGLAAIPANFRWGLLLLALAGLMFMLARGRRLGPPEVARRSLPPPRSAFVDAIGTALARTRDRDAAYGPVTQATGAEDLPERAEDDDDLLAAGRALARRRRTTGGRT